MEMIDVKTYLLDVVKCQARENTKTLNSALVDLMNQKNVGLISLANNGEHSGWDIVPKAYLVFPDKEDEGYSYLAREIVAILVFNNNIYVVPDTKDIENGLLDELQAYTHFTPESVMKLLDSTNLGNNIYCVMGGLGTYVQHRSDTMLSVFQMALEALEPIEKPLQNNIDLAFGDYK